MEQEEPFYNEVPMHEQEKQGGKCCGGCCDYRRAVIVLCIVDLVICILGISQELTYGLDSEYDGDAFHKLSRKVISEYSTDRLIMLILRIAMTLVALVGALIFNFYMVTIYVLWYILHFIVSTIIQKQMFDEMLDSVDTPSTDDAWIRSHRDGLESIINTEMTITFVLTTLRTALWVYPSVFLSVEIKKGIMTKETYPREEMSCCCVDQRN